MNKEEAAQILKEYLEDYRLRSYDELLCLVEDQHRYEVTGKSGQFYQIELSGFWDDKKLRHLRVCGSIDDGGLRVGRLKMADKAKLSCPELGPG